ncbi:MAG TPA: hypothetical protein VFA26_09085, partial [Gemmataceae bacterium]|nr:hypothetical protein [Gemmataceae bacterium]
KVIAGWGRLLPECRALVECCRCLARMGQPLEPTLTQAREAAGRLKRPEKYLKELDQLAAGERGA